LQTQLDDRQQDAKLQNVTPKHLTDMEITTMSIQTVIAAQKMTKYPAAPIAQISYRQRTVVVRVEPFCNSGSAF
jgi:hypothetical protein